MEDVIEKEKRKPGPSSYKTDNFKVKKMVGNYKSDTKRIDYFDQIKFFGQ